MFVGIYFVICALCSLQLTNAAATKTNDSTIVFPGPIPDVSNRQGTPNIPEECKGLDYCTVKPDDYPQEFFNELFKGKFKEPVYRPTYVMTDDRSGDPDERDDCETTVKYQPLYSLRTIDGTWYTVVQAPEQNYLQIARLESCNNKGGSCFIDFLPHGAVGSASCTQLYSTWSFLVTEIGGTDLKTMTVNIPTCCSCRYVKKAEE